MTSSLWVLISAVAIFAMWFIFSITVIYYEMRAIKMRK